MPETHDWDVEWNGTRYVVDSDQRLMSTDVLAVMAKVPATYRAEPHYVHPVSRRCLTCGAIHATQ